MSYPNCLSQSIYLIVTLIVIRGPLDITWAPIPNFAGDMIAAFAFGCVLLKSFSWPKPDIARAIQIFKSSWQIALSRVLRHLIFTFDVIAIGFVLTEYDVGLYTAPYRICFVFLAVATTIHISYLPDLARAWGTDPAEVNRLTNNSLWLALSISAPIFIGGAFVARPLLTLILGQDFSPGAESLQLLLASIFLIFIHKAFHNLLLTAHKLRGEVWVMIAAAAISIVLNLLLLPRYGIVAAAFSTACVEALVLLASWWLESRLNLRVTGVGFFPVLLACGGMLIVLALLGNQTSIFILIPTGAFVYAFLLILFRGVPPDMPFYSRLSFKR